MYFAIFSTDGITLPHDYTDFKFSSSTLRLALLGQLLKDPLSGRNKPKNVSWVIGLAGAIAAGKTSVARHLQHFVGDRLQILNGDEICQRALE